MLVSKTKQFLWKYDDTSSLSLLVEILQQLFCKIEKPHIELRCNIINCLLSTKLKIALVKFQEACRANDHSPKKENSIVDKLFFLEDSFLASFTKNEEENVNAHVRQLKDLVLLKNDQIAHLHGGREAREVCKNEFDKVVQGIVEIRGREFLQRIMDPVTKQFNRKSRNCSINSFQDKKKYGTSLTTGRTVHDDESVDLYDAAAANVGNSNGSTSITIPTVMKNDNGENSGRNVADDLDAEGLKSFIELQIESRKFAKSSKRVDVSKMTSKLDNCNLTTSKWGSYNLRWRRLQKQHESEEINIKNPDGDGSQNCRTIGTEKSSKLVAVRNFKKSDVSSELPELGFAENFECKLITLSTSTPTLTRKENEQPTAISTHVDFVPVDTFYSKSAPNDKSPPIQGVRSPTQLKRTNRKKIVTWLENPKGDAKRRRLYFEFKSTKKERRNLGNFENSGLGVSTISSKYGGERQRDCSNGFANSFEAGRDETEKVRISYQDRYLGRSNLRSNATQSCNTNLDLFSSTLENTMTATNESAVNSILPNPEKRNSSAQILFYRSPKPKRGVYLSHNGNAETETETCSNTHVSSDVNNNSVLPVSNSVNTNSANSNYASSGETVDNALKDINCAVLRSQAEDEKQSRDISVKDDCSAIDITHGSSLISISSDDSTTFETESNSNEKGLGATFLNVKNTNTPRREADHIELDDNKILVSTALDGKPRRQVNKRIFDNDNGATFRSVKRKRKSTPISNGVGNHSRCGSSSTLKQRTVIKFLRLDFKKKSDRKENETL